MTRPGTSQIALEQLWGAPTVARIVGKLLDPLTTVQLPDKHFARWEPLNHRGGGRLVIMDPMRDGVLHNFHARAAKTDEFIMTALSLWGYGLAKGGCSELRGIQTRRMRRRDVTPGSKKRRKP